MMTCHCKFITSNNGTLLGGGMSRMGEAMHLGVFMKIFLKFYEKNFYEKSLCFPLSFAVNLNHSKHRKF